MHAVIAQVQQEIDLGAHARTARATKWMKTASSGERQNTQHAARNTLVVYRPRSVVYVQIR